MGGTVWVWGWGILGLGPGWGLGGSNWGGWALGAPGVTLGELDMTTTIKDIVAEMRSLEPFPGVAARVLELSGQASVVPGDLIELVQTDPGITSKVLKLCNLGVLWVST